MKGQPEIVKIRWLTFEEALDGINGGAKIYKSQQGILKQAHEFLTTTTTTASATATTTTTKRNAS